MDCETARNLINEYIDGRLDKEEISGLVSHLQNCAVCAAELKKSESLKILLNNLPQVEPPAGLLKSAILRAKRELQAGKRPSLVKRTVAIAAAVVVTLGVGSYVLFGSRMQAPSAESAPAAPNAVMLERDAAASMDEESSEMKMNTLQGEAPAESMAAASAAPAESSEAPAAYSGESTKGADNAGTADRSAEPSSEASLVIVLYIVPPEVKEDFTKDLQAFMDIFELEPIAQEGGADSITIVVPAELKEDFVRLLDAYGLMDKELPAFPIKATFQFSKP